MEFLECNKFTSYFHLPFSSPPSLLEVNIDLDQSSELEGGGSASRILRFSGRDWRFIERQAEEDDDDEEGKELKHHQFEPI